MPIVMKKDIPFDINTVPLELHIATKMYIILRNADKNLIISKETRRLKDFYDLHNLLQLDYNEDLLQYYFDQLCMERSEYNLNNIDINKLGKEFVDINDNLYLEDKKRYGFNEDVKFDDLVYDAKDSISKRI